MSTVRDVASSRRESQRKAAIKRQNRRNEQAKRYGCPMPFVKAETTAMVDAFVRAELARAYAKRH